MILPDGSRHEFMYPSNRDIDVGEKFSIQMNSDSVQVATVYEIETHDREIHYLLKI